MKDSVRRVVIGLLLLLFLGSGAMLAVDFAQKRAAEKAYREAEQLVNLPELSQQEESEPEPESSAEELPQLEEVESEPEPEPEPEVYVDPYADALQAMDFAALRAANPDVLGWILIPDTKISYPLVQGTDNEYYLNRTWRKNYSSVGSIFLECRNAAGFRDFNTIIYGHHMLNGSMFGGLDRFKDAEYLAAHPSIYITDDAGCHVYDIYSVFEAPVKSPVYALGVEKDSDKQIILDWTRSQSLVETGVTPEVHDRIVTLSTCTGDGYENRLVVMGVLRTEQEPDESGGVEETLEESSEILPRDAEAEPEPIPEETGEPVSLEASE